MNYDDAARLGAKRMFPPVLAAMLTTVAAFLPVLMVGNDVGNIISAVPITLTLIIIASLIECFLILPHHLRTSMKKITQKQQSTIRTFDIYFNKFRDQTVLPIVEKTFNKKGFTVIATICLFIASTSLLSTGRVNFEFFDTPESDTIHANFSFSPGTPDNVTRKMVQELSQSVQATEIKLTGEIGSLVNYGVGNIGRSDSGRGNLTNNISGGHIGSYTVEMVPGDIRGVRNIEFMEAWENETKLMSGIESFVIFESPTEDHLEEILILGSSVRI